MFRILIFFLIFTSFSCATLDSNLKENPNIEETEKLDEPKKESSSVVLNDNLKASNYGDTSKEIPITTEEDANHIQEATPVLDIQKEEDKQPSIPSSKIKKEKEEVKKEEKPNKETTTKDVLSNKNETDGNKEKDTKTKVEKNKKTIADEKALQDYSSMFPTHDKIESKKEEKKKEENIILPFLEILKELEDAMNSFEKTPPTLVKQRVEKDTKIEVIAQEPKLEPPIQKDTMEDDKLISNDENTVEFENDELAFNDDNENVLIFDDDSTLGFDTQESMDAPADTSFDDDIFFTFDDEQKEEDVTKQEKKEEPDNKGQLSSVVDEQDKVNISRYTNILKGQNIDFSYPGEGWVYLGEETSQKGLNYVKRKMEDGKTFFTFNAENTGNYVLNFSYFDVFSGDFIVDAVSVKVEPNNDSIKKDSLVFEYQEKNEKKLAETKPKKIPNEVNVDADKVSIKTEDTGKKEEKKPAKQTKPNLNDKTEKIKPATPSKNESIYKEPEVFTNIASISPENVKTKVAGEEAKKIIDEVSRDISNGNAKKALERLEDFFAIASTNMDEAYFLRGKAYELNTELKNIKMALASYKFLTKTFPNSPLWNEADARIRYIEKFFVKIK